MVHTTRPRAADWGMAADGAGADATRESILSHPEPENLPMWPSIVRARRRIGLSPAPPEPATTFPADTPGDVPEGRLDDVVIVLARPDFDRLRTALAVSLGDPDERPDTPARMGVALAAVLADRGVTSHPTFLRRPATVSVPEAWEVHLTMVDSPTCERIREAARTGRFEP